MPARAARRRSSSSRPRPCPEGCPWRGPETCEWVIKWNKVQFRKI
jgi:hypothetical protein